MKRSPGFLRGFLVVLGILLGAAIYIGMVVFPIVEDINQLKREKKDIELQIEDFKQQAHRFFIIDQREKKLMESSEKRLMAKVLKTATAAEIDTATAAFKQTLLGLSRDLKFPDDAIAIEEDPSQLEKRLKRDGLRLSGDKTERMWTFPYSDVARMLYIALSAPLPQTLSYLNRLPTMGNRYLGIDSIQVMAGKSAPLVVVSATLHFCRTGDCRPKDLIEHAEKHGVIVDDNADILLERVYWYSEQTARWNPEVSFPQSPIFVEKTR